MQGYRVDRTGLERRPGSNCVATGGCFSFKAYQEHRNLAVESPCKWQSVLKGDPDYVGARQRQLLEPSFLDL